MAQSAIDPNAGRAPGPPASAPPCNACPVETEAAPPRAASGRTFRVHGLDCAEEVSAIERELGPLLGGTSPLAFDVLNGRMTVAREADSVPDTAVRAAVARAGMRCERLGAGGSQPGAETTRQRRAQLWLTVLSGCAVALGLGLHIWLAGGLAEAYRLATTRGVSPPAVEIAAYVLAILAGGRYVVVKAWYAARRLSADMNLLMVIAVAGAVAIGQWFEAATVTFLFALSLLLESWSLARARQAVAALLDLAPPTARVRLDSGEARTIDVAEVAIGTRFIVRPGERIALDGVVRAGASAVNQAPITGESVALAVESGSTVFAGTINGDGVLEVESTTNADNTTVARIIRLVEGAHLHRARAEQWVEKFARLYTPAVLVLAALVFLVPPLLFGAPWALWFYRALVLLVLACPCALVISTPVSIVAALAAAARNGVLVKGGEYLEQPASIRAFAFDKTGTLTTGRPSVVEVVPIGEHDEQQVIERAAALETHAHHPLGEAIVEYAAARGIRYAPAGEVRTIPGKGVHGRCGGREFWIGSHRYLLERGQQTHAVTERSAALEGKGRTVMVVGNEHHVCGLIAVADTLRGEAHAALAALREAGVEHLVMLTGDNRTTAAAIAARLGLDEVHSELLPEDKLAVMQALVARYGRVAMVGDGVNDAPAMACASIGVAMGAAGSDTAIETADIALMTDDLGKLPWMVGLSRRVLRVVRANIGFALAVKLVVAGLAFAGLASLWGAIAADVGASLLVVANGLRLLRTRRFQ